MSKYTLILCETDFTSSPDYSEATTSTYDTIDAAERAGLAELDAGMWSYFEVWSMDEDGHLHDLVSSQGA